MQGIFEAKPHQAKRRGVAFWEARPDVITGQSHVSKRAFRALDKEDTRIFDCRFPASFTLASVTLWLTASAKLLLLACVGRIDIAYLVCSRSRLGFIRDIPALFAVKLRVRVIAHCHGADFPQLFDRFVFGRLAAWLYRDVELIIPSAALKDHVLKYVSSVYVCEGFFEGDAIVDSSDLPTKDSPFSVFWNSNIMSSKGFFEVFSAVEALFNSGYNIRLVSVGRSVGDGEMSVRAVEEALASMSLSPFFVYHGAVSHHVCAGMLSTSDVVCLPSRYTSELQPVAVIEAMCMGVPLIISDTAVMRALAGSYPAFFVAPHGWHEIAERIKDVYNSKARLSVAAVRDARNARAQSARDRFSVERFDCDLRAAVLRER